jgi:hypothetical protein
MMVRKFIEQGEPTMKHPKTRALSLCLILILLTGVMLPMLTACGGNIRIHLLKGEEQAMYLFQAVNQNAAKATSGTMEQKLYLKLTLDGVDYEQSTTARVSHVSREGEQSSTITHVTREIRAGDTHTVTYNDYGYLDGMMFSLHREGDAVSRMKSPITATEYEDFNAEQNRDEPEIAVGEELAETMSCQKNPDGGWTATFEDFTEAGLAPFWEMLAGVETAVTAEHTLDNVRLTCTADKHLYMTSLSIQYLFTENLTAQNPVPVVRIDFTYSGWNETEAEDYDLSDFTEVEDIRYVEQFLDALEDRQTAAAGSFTVVSESEAKIGDETNRQNAAQVVVFDTADGYRFTAKTYRAAYDTIVTYRDGILSSEVRGHDSGELLNRAEDHIEDYEAQASVQRLMNSENLRELDLVSSTIVSASKDLYRFNLGDSVRGAVADHYQSVYGAEIQHFEGYVEATMTVDDGELEGYVYVVTVTVKLGDKAMTVTTRTTVTFDTPTEGGTVV